MSSRNVFNAIAPIYGLFFRFQVRYYRKLLKRIRADYDILQHRSIVDAGCGTGALCFVLQAAGLRVTGIDHAAKMLAIAGKKLAHTDVTLVQANAAKPLPLSAKSFDAAILSYTIHGMPAVERQKMYREMSRLARHHVIFHDYNRKRAWLTDFLEHLEGGDYFNFIKNAELEMRDNFKDVTVLTVDTQAAWYICTPYDDQQP